MKDKKLLFAVIIGLTLAVAYLIYSMLSTPPTINEAEQVAIYTAVIRQQYTVDDTFGGTLNAPITYIVNSTNDAIGDPDGKRSDPITLSPTLQQQISTNLSDLPTQIIWVDSSSQVPIDSQSGMVAGEGVIITIGNIHAQADNSVHVASSIYIANLAAGGQTYILQSSGENWSVTGTTGVQWIS